MHYTSYEQLNKLWIPTNQLPDLIESAMVLCILIILCNIKSTRKTFMSRLLYGHLISDQVHTHTRTEKTTAIRPSIHRQISIQTTTTTKPKTYSCSIQNLLDHKMLAFCKQQKSWIEKKTTAILLPLQHEFEIKKKIHRLPQIHNKWGGRRPLSNSDSIHLCHQQTMSCHCHSYDGLQKQIVFLN